MMHTLNLLFVLILSNNFCAYNVTADKFCKTNEDCSTQMIRSACSFCASDKSGIGSSKCVMPFDKLYNIDPNTLQCTFRAKKDVCAKQKPCKNGGRCYDYLYELDYLCECKPYHVGKQCERRYDKIEKFYVKLISYTIAPMMCQSVDVEVIISLSNKVQLDKVVISTEDGYYVYLKSVQNRGGCKSNGCILVYKGHVRFSYQPRHPASMNLHKILFGYITKFDLDIYHQGTSIFKRSFQVFVKYPEKNVCLPVYKLNEGCSSYNKPTVYNRWHSFRISPPSIRLFNDGNSLDDGLRTSYGLCTHRGIILMWKVWWMRPEGTFPDVPTIERFDQESITLNALTDKLQFGMYRVELDVQNVFRGLTSKTFAFCYFEIESLPLEAVIEGGTHRSASNKEGLLLSALNSVDPNQLSFNQFIMTKWSCSVVNSPRADASDICKPVVLPYTETYFIPADRLPKGEFIFTLEVWSDVYKYMKCRQCKKAKMHQFTHQTVVVTGSLNPVILCQVNCGKSVVVSSELILKVSYLDKPNEKFRWTFIKIENQRNTTLPVPKGYSAYIFNVQEDGLEPSSNYLVSVSVLSEGVERTGMYGFKTEDFSYTGNCTVLPESGVRGVTYFDISCSVVNDEALTFEFYDKTQGGNKSYVSDRMLGTSNNGELEEVILTRGVVVVYVIRGISRYSLSYTVNLTDNVKEQEALIKNMLFNPLFLEGMPFAQILQHISSMPDIMTNNSKVAMLNVLLPKLLPRKIKQIDDVKLNSLILSNTLLKLDDIELEDLNLNAVRSVRRLVYKMTDILRGSITESVKPSSWTEVKETTAIIINILERTLVIENKTAIIGASQNNTVNNYLDLAKIGVNLSNILKNIETILSVYQKSGLPPTTISSDNGNLIFKALQEDPKYNIRLTQILQEYPDVPITISSVLMDRLTKSIEPNDRLSICVGIISKNLFPWSYNGAVSNLLFVSINKHTEGNEMTSMREITSPMDMEMHLNNSLQVVEMHSETFPLDPASGEDDLDLQVKVHRFEPSTGSKLSVTFLYPPTVASLRVLIMEGYRPTFKMMMTDSILISKQSPYYSPNFTATKAHMYYYMGVVPGPGNLMNETVLFSFTVNSTTCVSWEKVEWSSDGCNVGSNSSGPTIHCQCNHLSIFGALFPFTPNHIDPFSDISLFLSVWDNPLIISMMTVILVLYLILSIFAHHADKKDRFRGTITVLRDNLPLDKHPYVLAIYTSSRLFAGTSANVGVKLHGELANSRAHILSSNHYKVFRRYSDDWFLMLCPKPLGIIRYLQMWHDNTGLSPDWYCVKVHVYDITNCLECFFIVEQWLELNSTNHPEALICPASSDDILKIKHVLSENISKCMREQRFVTGVLTQHPRSTVKRVQRVNMFTCSLLIALLFSIMFYTDPKEPKPDGFQYKVENKDLIISSMTVFIIVSVNYVIHMLFERSYKFVIMRNRSSLYLRRSQLLDEYFDPKHSRRTDIFIPNQVQAVKTKGFKKRIARVVEQIVKTEKLAPAVLPHTDSATRVNQFWLILTWSVCAVIIILCAYLITLYGLKMGLINSKKWLTSIFISYVYDKVLINPLSIVLLAASITASFGFVALCNYRATNDEIQLSMTEIQNDLSEEIFTKRKQPMYSPMKLEVRKKMIKKKLKVLYCVKTLRFLISLCYIIIVVNIVHKLRHFHFHRTSHLEVMITTARWDDSSNGFYESYDLMELRSYFNNDFLKVIFSNRWYNAWPLSQNDSSMYWTYDYSWRLVGTPSVRQQRVYNVSCNSFVPPVNSCIPHWGPDEEDRDPYSSGWNTYSPLDVWDHSFDDPWIYTQPTANWLKTFYRLQGQSDIIYNNGGYKTRIGSSAQETVKIVTKLGDKVWIDELTKVVFLELTLYNVNLRSLSQVTLIIEFLTGGVSLKAARISSVLIECTGLKYRHMIFIVLTLLFVLEIFYQMNYYGFLKFFKDVKNILLLVIVIPSILLIVAFLYYLYRCFYFDLWERYYRKEHDYFDFDTFMSFHNNIVFTLSFFLLLSVLRTLLLLCSENIFLKINKLFKLVPKTVVILITLTILSFTFLFCVIIHLEAPSSHRIMDVIISQKKPKSLGSEHLLFESVFFSIIKYCAMVFLSSIFITIFVQLNSTSSSVKT